VLSQMLTLFTTPVIHLLLARAGSKRAAKAPPRPLPDMP